MDRSKYRKQLRKVDKCIVKKNKKRVKMKRTNRLNKKKRPLEKVNGGQHHGGKTIANRRLTSGRLKPLQRHEGLFLKGLRTRYVKRTSLNNADEARRKEDINRIIDLGKLIQGIPVTETSRYSPREVEKKKTPESGKIVSSGGRDKNSPRENSMDLDACSLSPIRFSRDAVVCPGFETRRSTNRPPDTSTRERKKMYTFEMNFVEEFRKFALDLEDYSGSEILLRLPQEGVLEAAMKSLSSIYMSHKESVECVNSEEEEDEREDGFDEVGFFPLAERLGENEFESGHQLFAREYESSIMDALISGKGTGLDQSAVVPLMSISPVDNDCGLKFLDFDMNHIDNPSHSSFYCTSGKGHLMSLFDDGTEEGNNWPGKEVDFDTPPIQFYRRNMF